MASVRQMTLNDGHTMPALAYGSGTVHIEWVQKNYGFPKLPTADLVAEALKLGFRHLDNAEQYSNSDDVGEGIEKSGVPRRDIFLTSKVTGGNGLTTEEVLNNELKALKTDYLDLFLVHNPAFATSDKDLQDKWSEMEALQAAGKIKSIGVSNFNKAQVQAVLKTAKVKPVVNQIEYHAYQQHSDLVAWLKGQDILVSCYSTMIPLTFGRPGPMDDLYAELAKKHGVTESDVALKFCLDQGFAAAATTKNADRMKGYLEAASGKFTFSEQEIAEMKEVGGKKDFTPYGVMGGKKFDF